MGLQKVAFNFMVERGGKLAKSWLCSKPQKAVTSFKGLKYTPLKTDIVQFSEINRILSRFNNPKIEYKPTTNIDTHIPMHGAVETSNGSFRLYLGESKYNIELANQIRAIDESFMKIKPLEKDCIGYRGMVKPNTIKNLKNWEYIKNAKPGDIITPDIGYSYVSYREELARGSFLDSNKESILIKYLFPKGAKISRWRSPYCEVEYLTPRSALCRVIEKKEKGNITEYTLEYLLPERDNLKEIEMIMKNLNIPINGRYRQLWIEQL